MLLNRKYEGVIYRAFYKVDAWAAIYVILSLCTYKQIVLNYFFYVRSFVVILCICVTVNDHRFHPHLPSDRRDSVDWRTRFGCGGTSLASGHPVSREIFTFLSFCLVTCLCVCCPALGAGLIFQVNIVFFCLFI